MNLIPLATEAAAATSASGAGLLGWLLIAIPLISAAILLVLGKAANSWGHWLGLLAAAADAVIGLVLLFTLLGQPAGARVLDVPLFNWVPAGDFSLTAGLRIDPLSVTFVVLVTFVGALIHMYSVGYMKDDPARRRFFAYLNLFIAAMLILVLANSYLLLFVGWEGVGLASYLLIGFWNYNRDYAVAAKKAFIANRIGDLGMLIAIFLMFASFHAVTFTDVFAGATGMKAPLATAIGLMLLLAACGKSAQFPLQSWLGDAMAGPTPVSALIHAATMVTAGVYLVVRSAPIFDQAPTARLVVTIIAAITLLFGAAVGCAKDDIKKALAASTMSQIGYMMLAAGLGPIGAVFAILHLVTHGFFKAGLFLGAGSVMHGMNDTTDMRRFGHLSTVMKVTWLTMMMGWLAILGIPPFSGFWSKDKIIEAAFTGEGWQPWVFGLVALIGAGITAFYMSRLFFMTFHGKARWEDDMHPHESGPWMTIPMIVLAIGSIGLGWVLSINGMFGTWLAPVTGEPGHHEPVLSVPVLTGATLVLVVLGALWAYLVYGRRAVPTTAPRGTALTRLARVDFGQDAVNNAVLVRPGTYLTRALVFLDSRGVDGIVNGVAAAVSSSSRGLRRIQNGFVRSYAAEMLAGILLLIAVILAVRV